MQGNKASQSVYSMQGSLLAWHEQTDLGMVSILHKMLAFPEVEVCSDPEVTGPAKHQPGHDKLCSTDIYTFDTAGHIFITKLYLKFPLAGKVVY